jgi:hypothetical protein
MSNGQVTGVFDASQFQPRQAGEAHPVGDFDFTITGCEIKSTKDNSGGYFQVEFTSPRGSIIHRYNIWYNDPNDHTKSAKTVEIAHGQLSALCHATGVYKINWQNQGRELLQARGKMRVGYQKGEEPTEAKPQGGYVELKRVFDIHGNEPGKAPATAPQPQQAAPNGGWGQTTATGQAPINQGGQHSAPAWNNTAPAQQAEQAAPGWSQGQASKTPPWGAR